MQDFSNPDLKNIVPPDTELKKIIIEYVGKKINSHDVTAEKIVEVMAEEFPEFLLIFAEENFIRGYEQALQDASDQK